MMDASQKRLGKRLYPIAESASFSRFPHFEEKNIESKEVSMEINMNKVMPASRLVMFRSV